MSKSVFPVHGHDHGDCINKALSAAEGLCLSRGAKLTATRRRVLELVWQGHTAIGAYDILDSLRADRGRAQPPTVYRALDFLLEQGLIHRIERFNAYVGCRQPDRHHAGQFLICNTCGRLAELDDSAIGMVIERRAELRGFKVNHATVEIEGLCPACQEDADGPSAENVAIQ